MKQIVQHISILGALISSGISIANDLDKIALVCGTDKSSRWHNYTSIYVNYFAALRNTPIKFLEIGFAQGCSARTWDQYFVNGQSQLYFIDVDQNCYRSTSGLSQRCKLDMVDQADSNALRSYIERVGGNFDVIIDDGRHIMEQQIVSFCELFPHVKSGGVYIIEDLHTSYSEEYGGSPMVAPYDSPRKTMVNFLKNLIDDLNCIFDQKRLCADRQKCLPEIWQTLSYTQKYIKSMHFYGSLAFIFKS